jgi:xanthine/uracil permease
VDICCVEILFLLASDVNHGQFISEMHWIDIPFLTNIQLSVQWPAFLHMCLKFRCCHVMSMS